MTIALTPTQLDTIHTLVYDDCTATTRVEIEDTNLDGVVALRVGDARIYLVRSDGRHVDFSASPRRDSFPDLQSFNG